MSRDAAGLSGVIIEGRRACQFIGEHAGKDTWARKKLFVCMLSNLI
jgi:hypothetical protein